MQAFRLALYLALFAVTAAQGLAQQVVTQQAAAQVEAAQVEAAPYDPVALLLTWQRDPTTTMTIDWQTIEGDEPRDTMQYRRVGEQQWAAAKSTQFPFHKPGAPKKIKNRVVSLSDRIIHRVELTGLQPQTVYEFRIGEDDKSRVFQFRTMPAQLTRPLLFAAGGDVRYTEMTEKTNREAMKHDLDFVVWGGDISYGNWEGLFSAIKSTLVSPQGRVIPIVAAIGNHEVAGGYISKHPDYQPTKEWRMDKAYPFYTAFAFPGQPGYNVLDFGDYLSFVALDTNHTNPIKGEQTEWLKATLQKRQDVPHVFPVYHVPAYPGHRNPGESRNEEVRYTWGPIFDQFNVRLAFENHDHTYKRTHPIRAGKIDPAGVVYVGDGAWSVQTRRARTAESTWYIANSKPARHFILVKLEGAKREFHVIDEDGNEIDRYDEAEAAKQAVVARKFWDEKAAAAKAASAAAKAARKAAEKEAAAKTE